MDGLLIVDKPVGPSSHDVVTRVRRALREPRIGHTGTLDPMASGLLALVLGRATRLARFLSSDDKTYEAEVRLGVATDTYDAKGTAIGTPSSGPFPTAKEIERALDEFRGAFLQHPPPYSAKKIDGTRSYKLARQATPDTMPAPPAAQVTARAIEILEFSGDRVQLRVECSSGFYIRSLAHDLGVRVGTGAHLTRLRRTGAGEFRLAQAISASLIERSPEQAAAAVIPLAAMLQGLAAAVLNENGELRVAHGRDLGPGDVQERRASTIAGPARGVRLIDRQGRLVGIAEEPASSGVLHPSVVLM